jgi:hypothetical protein
LSLATQVTALASVIGTALKAVKATADSKYTLPSNGIPRTTLTTDVQSSLTKADNSVFQTTEVNNADLAVSSLTDASGVRSWIESGFDMGPTEYAFSRMAPGVAKQLGFEFVTPTGGASDEVAINTALARSSCVVLSGNYRTSAPIQMPSHTTLILKDAHVVLEDGLTCNILTNSNLAVNGNTGIRVVGIGKAILDGNAGNQVRSSTESWRNVGVHWVGVSNFQVTGITIRNTSNFSALHVGCSRGSWTNITLDQNRVVINQDGLDFGPGNSFIYVDGVYGRVEDDCFSIFAKYSTGGGSIHPAFSTGGDTHHLYFSNIFLDTYRSLFRLQAAEGSSLHHIYADNVHHTGVVQCTAFLNLGELKSAYVKGPYPDASGNDFYAIYLNNVSGRVKSMVRMSSNVKDVYCTNFKSDNWGYIYSAGDGDVGNAFNINIDGVTTALDGANSYGTVVELDQPSHATTGLSITNMNLARVDRITYSAMPVTASRLTGIIGNVVTRGFGGAVSFTGEVDLTVKTTPTTPGTPPTSPGFAHYRNNT